MIATRIPAIQAFVIDEGQARNFLFQVALARSLAEAVRTAWDSMDQLQIEDFFGALRADLTPGGTPLSGSAAIRSGAGEVRRRLRQLYPALWREFSRHCHSGAGPMKGFLDAQDEMHRQDLFDIRSISLQAMKVSARVDDVLKELLAKLERMKSAAEVALDEFWIDTGPGAPALIICPESGFPLAAAASADWAKAGDAQVLLAQTSTPPWPDVPTASGAEEPPGFIIHAHVCVPDHSPPKRAGAGQPGQAGQAGQPGQAGPAKQKLAGAKRPLTSPRDADKALRACGLRTAGQVLRGAACWNVGHVAVRAAQDLQSWLDR